MKNYYHLLLMATILISLAAQAAKVLTVYFSHSGNTKTVAEQIHKNISWDIFEVKTIKQYPTNYNAGGELIIALLSPVLYLSLRYYFFNAVAKILKPLSFFTLSLIHSGLAIPRLEFFIKSTISRTAIDSICSICAKASLSKSLDINKIR